MDVLDCVTLDRAAELIGGDRPVSRSTIQRMIRDGVLEARGADPRAAQDLAGHASPITTQRIYAKSRATQRRDIIEKTQERRKRRQG